MRLRNLPYINKVTYISTVVHVEIIYGVGYEKIKLYVLNYTKLFIKSYTLIVFKFDVYK